ncbi:hypothetical protein [Streptoalloteichus tenebrarius]|uniref:hypothetical protein n=1 Tax=Streptoalloteichus tenebrarius (strain ATCC 17920 / DSM 40477 / JCM 4838 / CBS 697.72 / NBRC 16177 / NCIMB 11028 / NRRL B-12390 / A12253. 1 / ISP 5477) TaxID=1933 RepID=UPI0020A277A6|nr:hypothetical protein [Streptoalloteichus tenebrarius]BFE99169.1 hypothetical protein GCM10020241_08450 [Streptoalloteichus tenebrarius]
MTITGARALAEQDAARLDVVFAGYLNLFARPDAHVYLGSATGIDTLALEWLAVHSPAAISVVVPRTVADQPDLAAETIRTRRERGRLTHVVELGADHLGAPARLVVPL